MPEPVLDQAQRSYTRPVYLSDSELEDYLFGRIKDKLAQRYYQLALGLSDLPPPTPPAEIPARARRLRWCVSTAKLRYYRGGDLLAQEKEYAASLLRLTAKDYGLTVRTIWHVEDTTPEEADSVRRFTTYADVG